MIDEVAGDYLMLDNEQAAQLFRSLVHKGGCQHERGRMRWWFDANLRLELVERGWRLYMVPTRNQCP